MFSIKIVRNYILKKLQTLFYLFSDLRRSKSAGCKCIEYIAQNFFFSEDVLVKIVF